MGPINNGEGDRFIEKLYRMEVIEQFIATFWFNKEGGKSSLTFGGMPEELVDLPSLKLEDTDKRDMWWSLDLAGF